MSDCEARDCSSQAIYQCLCTRQIKLCEFHYDDHYNRCRISSRIILPQREIFNQKSFDLSSKQDNMLISKRISKLANNISKFSEESFYLIYYLSILG